MAMTIFYSRYLKLFFSTNTWKQNKWKYLVTIIENLNFIAH